MDSILALQNRVYCTRDVSFLNSFENVLINKIVWKLMLFWKKKNPCNYVWNFKEKNVRLIRLLKIK